MNTFLSAVFTAPHTPEFRATQSPTLNFKSASSSSQKVGLSLQTTPRKHCTHVSLGSYSPRNMFVFYPFPGPDKLFTRSQWFPDAYYGQGQSGHRCHIFDEVRHPGRGVVPSVVLTTSNLCITGFSNKKSGASTISGSAIIKYFTAGSRKV